jgi:hypothetical protein
MLDRSMVRKILEEPMVFILWEIDDGYIFTIHTYQGVAGDREHNILLSKEEGQQLRSDPQALGLKYAAIAKNPELFRDQFVDLRNYK